jgi:O-antigen ligase
MIPGSRGDEGERGRIYRLLDLAVQGGTVGILFIPVLLFGGVTPAGRIVTASLFALLMACYLAMRTMAWREWQRRRQLHTHRRREPVVVLAMLGGLLAYGLLTILPLPAGLASLLQPAGAELRQLATGAGLGPAGGVTLSVDPSATLRALARLAIPLGLFYLWLTVPWDLPVLRRLLSLFVAGVALVSFLGVLQLLSAQQILWGPRITSTYASAFGPFANRNHFATWGGAGALAGAGLFLSLAYRREGVCATGLRRFEFQGGRSGPQSMAAYLVAVTVVAVFLSLSRGGMVSLVAGFVFLAVLMILRGVAVRLLTMAGVGALVAGLVVWLGGDLVAEKVQGIYLAATRGEFDQARSRLYADLHPLLGDYPILGAGAGSFASIFPLYQTSFANVRFTYAHSDHLQLLAEWGVAGSLIWGALLVMVWRKFHRRWKLRHNREVLFLGAGAAAGVVGVLVHAAFDFSLRIPAVGVATAFLAAMAIQVAAAASSPRHSASAPGARIPGGGGGPEPVPPELPPG